MTRFASVVLDVDSTLCGVEGIDWLARRRGDAVAERVARLTDRAMSGEIALDAVYGERLELIRPTRLDVAALARVYEETLAPGAGHAIAAMRTAGARVVLVSGGLRPAIAPLADRLGVELHAVDVEWDSAGEYRGFEHTSPLTTQRGKRDVVRALALPRPSLAVGDGATDVVMRDAVDEFAAYVGFARRASVVAAASRVFTAFDEISAAVLEGPRDLPRA